jgi:hypothetical protein
MSVSLVNEYIKYGFDEVPGWCGSQFLTIMAHLGEEMNAIGISGGACEIGVYQGKFIIGLARAVDWRPSLAIDVFDNQQNNSDYSGAGLTNMLNGFREYVAKYGNSAVADLTADSFELSIKDQMSILDKFGRFQFFSIDGGHQPEHVINDYHFAESVTHPGGAIIIDDITNPGWPGVMEGVARLFVASRPKFVPFAIGHNKLVLTGLSYHRRYLDSLQSRLKTEMPGQEIWRTKFFGHEILSFV